MAYRLTTFLGPDDIRLIPAAEFSCDILAVTLQDGPIDLLRPDFNLTSAKTDSTTIAAEINLKIIRLATPSILDHLFNQLCLGYSKEPHAALDHIGRHTMMPPGIRFSPRSTSAILESSLPLVRSSTRRCFPSAFARYSWTVLILASSPAFAPTSPTTVSRKNARLLTPAQGPSGYAPSRHTCRNEVFQHQDNR